MKYLLAGIILFSPFLNVYAESLEGLWLWENNSNKHTFSVNITKSDNTYMGTYCAVGMSGNRTDCSPKHAKSFPVVADGSVFTFTTNYSKTVGKAKIQLLGKSLFWEIVSQPSGEHYAPISAELNKYNSHNNSLNQIGEKDAPPG